MGKRSDFQLKERSFYQTPREAVEPLIPHLSRWTTYAEPCAGAGALIDALRDLWPEGRLVFSGDIHPMRDGIETADVMWYDGNAEVIITNPVWPHRRGQPTLETAFHLSSKAPTWLLLPADFCHNRYFHSIKPRCAKCVSVGRVSWEQNGVSGKDNAAWYLFDAHHYGSMTFHTREARDAA